MGTTKKPLVLGADGTIQQLQAGDIVDVGAAKQVFSATNGNAGAITIGQAVYINGASSVDLADASADSTAKALGIVYDASVATGAPAVAITDGVLVSADWTGATGSATLTAGSSYFLSDSTPGMLTDVAPTVAGSSIVRIGTAISETELEISIGQPIKL